MAGRGPAKYSPNRMEGVTDLQRVSGNKTAVPASAGRRPLQGGLHTQPDTEKLSEYQMPSKATGQRPGWQLQVKTFAPESTLPLPHQRSPAEDKMDSQQPEACSEDRFSGIMLETFPIHLPPIPSSSTQHCTGKWGSPCPNCESRGLVSQMCSFKSSESLRAIMYLEICSCLISPTASNSLSLGTSSLCVPVSCPTESCLCPVMGGFSYSASPCLLMTQTRCEQSS